MSRDAEWSLLKDCAALIWGRRLSLKAEDQRLLERALRVLDAAPKWQLEALMKEAEEA